MENYEKRYTRVRDQFIAHTEPEIKFPWFPSSTVYKACGLQNASKKRIRASTIYRCGEARLVVQNTSIFLADETLKCMETNHLIKRKIKLKPNPPAYTAKGAMKALGFRTRQAFYKSREYKEYLLGPDRYFIVTKPLGKDKLALAFYNAEAIFSLQKAYIRFFADRVSSSSRDAYEYKKYMISEHDAKCTVCGNWGVTIPFEKGPSEFQITLCPKCRNINNQREYARKELAAAFVIG